ncbi:hypothetical protein [Acinetobacter sp. P8-3-8]|uniref:hypothetical protein n=1 Tax=Acinetobacter sp. P8-3-8 TaxID=1029823 RepID=UPI0002487AEC|nr:hypothetical protein [Acinetobacter sp. P8-3-8]
MNRILALILSLFISSFVIAATSTSAVRTSSGQIVNVGDTASEMMMRIAQSPVSMNSYEVKEGDLTVTASDYTYDIDNVLYTLTVINNQVRKIEWVRKDP